MAAPMPNTDIDEFQYLRKIPQQSRSRQLVESVLEASKKILETDGWSGLTTPFVARVADINIASVYQYFPDKESIIYTLYLRWVKRTYEIYDHYRPLVDNGMSLVTFLRGVRRDLRALPENQWGYRHMGYLVEMLPKLREMELVHEDKTAEYWSYFLRHYGATWPDDKLDTFCRYYYAQVTAANNIQGRLPTESANFVYKLFRKQMVFLLRQCLPKRRDSDVGRS